MLSTSSGSRPDRESLTPGRVTKAATLLLAALSTTPCSAVTLEASLPRITPTAVISGVTMLRVWPFTSTVPVSLFFRLTVTVRWPLLPIRSSRAASWPSRA
jgi:hypothetical protein